MLGMIKNGQWHRNITGKGVCVKCSKPGKLSKSC